MNGVEVIAHRGFSAEFPENTLPALLGAIDAGANALEWDIQVTSDGVPILFHDDDLDRTTDGRGPVGGLTSQELARLDAGSWFSNDFVGTRIPTLEGALAHLSGSEAHLYPELKAVRSFADIDPILALLRASGSWPRITLISLDHELLDEIRSRDPEIHLGWVVSRERDMERCIRKVESDRRALLDPRARLLLDTPSRTRDIVAAGIPLATWTVDEVETARSLYDLGVRRFTTNQVGQLVAWARTLAPEESDG